MTRWAPVLPVVLLLLILALVVRSLLVRSESARKLVGHPPGDRRCASLARCAALPLADRTSALVMGPLQHVPTLVLQESIAAVTLLAEEVFRPLTWQSLVVFILGLILIIVGAVVKPKAEQTAAEDFA